MEMGEPIAIAHLSPADHSAHRSRLCTENFVGLFRRSLIHASPPEQKLATLVVIIPALSMALWTVRSFEMALPQIQQPQVLNLRIRHTFSPINRFSHPHRPPE